MAIPSVIPNRWLITGTEKGEAECNGRNGEVDEPSVITVRDMKSIEKKRCRDEEVRRVLNLRKLCRFGRGEGTRIECTQSLRTIKVINASSSTNSEYRPIHDTELRDIGYRELVGSDSGVRRSRSADRWLFELSFIVCKILLLVRAKESFTTTSEPIGFPAVHWGVNVINTRPNSSIVLYSFMKYCKEFLVRTYFSSCSRQGKREDHIVEYLTFPMCKLVLNCNALRRNFLQFGRLALNSNVLKRNFLQFGV
ncbi:hypothetical protein Syun_006979 [Stephania yunnanensis]|uniref:Uncharacterized protein n=1 Tax=Stephania yunnanensis TaxID=152371 RepID=A0AAP0KZ36_9MAGN